MEQDNKDRNACKERRRTIFRGSCCIITFVCCVKPRIDLKRFRVSFSFSPVGLVVLGTVTEATVGHVALVSTGVIRNDLVHESVEFTTVGTSSSVNLAFFSVVVIVKGIFGLVSEPPVFTTWNRSNDVKGLYKQLKQSYSKHDELGAMQT